MATPSEAGSPRGAAATRPSTTVEEAAMAAAAARDEGGEEDVKIEGDVAFEGDATVANDRIPGLPTDAQPLTSIYLLPSSKEDSKTEPAKLVLDNDNVSTIGLLPHPRHGKAVKFLQVVKQQHATSSSKSAEEAAPTVNDETSFLYEVQQFRPDHVTWFVDQQVCGNQRPLYMATPFDPTFLALHLALKKKQSNDSFVEADDIISMVDKRVAGLHQDTLKMVTSCLDEVCEVKNAGDERFYRFSEDAAVSWLKRKFDALFDSGAILDLFQCKKDATNTHEALNKSKSLVVLLEYVDKSLHGAVTKACGVDTETSKAAAVSVQNATGSHYGIARGEDPDDDLAAKKKKKEASAPAKSMNVKKLEKAGAPKGTPTLMSMFAKINKKKEEEKKK